MKDKNGIEMKAGDIVEVNGAYFECDNGLYYIDSAPGDEGWSGNDYSLHRVTKRGKISKNGRVCFWPIYVYTNNRFKNNEIKAYNKEHATIEVRKDINRSDIKKHFEKHVDYQNEYIELYSREFGEDSEMVQREVKLKEFYQAVVACIY